MSKTTPANRKPRAAKPAQAKKAPPAAKTVTEAAPASAAADPAEPSDAKPDEAPQAAGEDAGRPAADGAPSAAGDGSEPKGDLCEGPNLPVAFVVTGPKKGFRRGGIAFGAEPVALTPADFGHAEGDEMEPATAERLLAVLSERKLKCVVRLEDGSEEPVVPELIEHLRAAIERSAEEA